MHANSAKRNREFTIMLFLGAMFPQVLRMLLLCMGLSTIATILLTDLGMRPCMNSPRGGDSGKVYGCISASTPVVFTYNLFLLYTWVYSSYSHY